MTDTSRPITTIEQDGLTWVAWDDYRALAAERDAWKAKAEAARNDALEEAAQLAEAAADIRCAKCGHPRSNHPYRHLFAPSRETNVAAAIRDMKDTDT